MRKSLAAISFISLLETGHAQLAIPSIPTQPLNNVAVQDQALARAGLMLNDDDIAIDQDVNKLQLNDEQLHEAKVWGLTLDEEKRYVFLMQNRSKIYYEGLRMTPLDILGLNARNEAERNHFAELAAVQEAQKVAKNIAWNNTFYKAYNRLFANTPVVGEEFDPSPFSPYAHKPVNLTSGDTLYLFIKADDPVKTILLTLIEALQITPNTKLHIMFLNADDLTIQQWANKEQLPQILVNNGIITLNHGNLNFDALTIKNKHTPLLLLAQNGSSRIVDLGRF